MKSRALGLLSLFSSRHEQQGTPCFHLAMKSRAFRSSTFSINVQQQNEIKIQPDFFYRSSRAFRSWPFFSFWNGIRFMIRVLILPYRAGGFDLCSLFHLAIQSRGFRSWPLFWFWNQEQGISISCLFKDSFRSRLWWQQKQQQLIGACSAKNKISRQR